MKAFITLASFLLIAISLLSLQTHIVKAQSGTLYCQNVSTGQIYRTDASSNCLQGDKFGSIPGTPYSSLCVATKAPFAVSAPTVAENDRSGKLMCPNDSKLQSLSSAPPTSGSNNQTTTTTSNSFISNQSTTQPKGITAGSQGSCPNGFTQKGPLCVPNNPFSGNRGIAGQGTLAGVVTQIISILLGMAGIVAVIFIIIGGYYYMTAGGNEAQAANGRKTLVNALIGLAIVVLSYLIVQIVTSFIITGN
jgi:hypothetical protein